MTSSTGRARRRHEPPAPPGYHFDERVENGVASCDLQAVNQKGEIVIKGSAEISV